jgi:hypothetical protein
MFYLQQTSMLIFTGNALILFGQMPSYEKCACGAIYLHWNLSTISCMFPYYLFKFHLLTRVVSEEASDVTLIRFFIIIIIFMIAFWKVLEENHHSLMLLEYTYAFYSGLPYRQTCLYKIY